MSNDGDDDDNDVFTVVKRVLCRLDYPEGGN